MVYTSLPTLHTQTHAHASFNSVLHPFFYSSVNFLFSGKETHQFPSDDQLDCCPEVHFICSVKLTDVEKEMKAFEAAQAQWTRLSSTDRLKFIGHKDKGVSKIHSRLTHLSFTVYQHVGWYTVKERCARRFFDCKSVRKSHFGFDNEDENKLYWKNWNWCKFHVRVSLHNNGSKRAAMDTWGTSEKGRCRLTELFYELTNEMFVNFLYWCLFTYWTNVCA